MERSNNGISGTINLNDNLVVDLTGKVHQLPCCIKFNGPSHVSHYFKPKSTGFVLGKKMPDEKRKRSEEDSSCWEMKAKLQNITLWNHDSLPSENDASLRAFHLFSVATALHQPVSVEDLEAASIDQELEL
ncbi:uncharacterized protein LOC132623907 isoform X2 [Lycium barbarum]|uniref:uncharacterized protein LOC132623907 isoform X2 n=1 Tax=Lycium barbarum TaxID=112863 RepID=UPI00293EE488|nr:uncharacterized protein LOC132623907 isoform X2 [Lycium barbarum]